MTFQQLSLDLGASPQRRGDGPPRGRDACVYCGALATSRDHVPPRFLLEKPLPRDLLTVASCSDCNNSFSLDEQYLQVVIAQIGHVPHLMAKVEEGGVVDRALERDAGLDQRIVDSLEVRPDGRVGLVTEKERILRIVQKIAYGLFVSRYGKRAHFDAFSALAVYGPGKRFRIPLLQRATTGLEYAGSDGPVCKRACSPICSRKAGCQTTRRSIALLIYTARCWVS